MSVIVFPLMWSCNGCVDASLGLQCRLGRTLLDFHSYQLCRVWSGVLCWTFVATCTTLCLHSHHTKRFWLFRLDMTLHFKNPECPSCAEWSFQLLCSKGVRFTVLHIEWLNILASCYVVSGFNSRTLDLLAFLNIFILLLISSTKILG